MKRLSHPARRRQRTPLPPPPPSSPLLLALPCFLLTRILAPLLLPLFSLLSPLFSVFSFLSTHSTPHPRLLLYDGICNVCNTFVNFILDHDPHGQFHFLPLSSPVAQVLLTKFNLPKSLDSMVLIDHADELIRHIQSSPNPLTTPFPSATPSTLCTHSTAFISTVASLGFPFSLLSLLLLIPRAIRDVGYKAFASVRYRVFGTGEECRLLTNETKKRFLDGRDGSKDEKVTRKVK